MFATTKEKNRQIKNKTTLSREINTENNMIKKLIFVFTFAAISSAAFASVEDTLPPNDDVLNCVIRCLRAGMGDKCGYICGD